MWYRVFLAGLLISAVALGACQDEKDEILFGNPVDEGMGAAAAGSAAIGVAVISGVIDATATGSRKPSAPGVVIGAAGDFPPSSSLSCGGGGGISFSDITSTSFNGTVSPACQTNGYAFSTGQNGIQVTNMTLAACDEDGQTTQVPVSAHVVVTGAVTDLGGQSISMNGLTFDFATTIPGNVASSYSTGSGGTCSLQSGVLTINGGSVSTSIAGETIRTTFPGGTINASFTDASGSTSISMSGDVTINAPCTSGEYAVSLVTIDPIVFTDGDTEPSQGSFEANGTLVDPTAGAIPAMCDGSAFGG